jgi:hypothetical protein
LLISLLGILFTSAPPGFSQEVGAGVTEFIGTLPNTASREQIRQERIGINGKVAAEIEQEVQYVLLFHQTGEDLWEEDRTDNKGKPARIKRLKGQSFVISGFAMACAYLS